MPTVNFEYSNPKNLVTQTRRFRNPNFRFQLPKRVVSVTEQKHWFFPNDVSFFTFLTLIGKFSRNKQTSLNIKTLANSINVCIFSNNLPKPSPYLLVGAGPHYVLFF